jgi:hypothetical protein
MGQNSAIAVRPATGNLAAYTWWFPGSPVKVQLQLGVVERLQDLLAAGAATQGLLTGRAVGQTTRIHDFKVLPGAEPPSAESVEAAIASVAGADAVGYFRITREAALRLNDSDISLAEAVFADPHHVFLLIQINEPQPPTATFFFWDQQRLCGDFPFLEFPFDAPTLALAEQHKRETAQKKIAARPEVLDPKVASAEPPVRRRMAIPVLVRWGLPLILAGSLAVWAAVRFLPPWLARFNRPAAAPGLSTTPARPPLGLNAERQDGDLRLRWNRDSGAILNATSAVLAIEDGGAIRKITLDPVQVRSGSILYAPTSDQVQMQLTVIDPENTTSESVIVILPKTGAPQVRPMAQKVTPAGSPEADQPEDDVPSSPLVAKRPFTPPAASAQQARALQLPVDERAASNALSNNALATPALINQLAAQLPAVPAPNANAPMSGAPARPASQPPPVKTDYQPPAPLNRVMPRFPSTLRVSVNRPLTVEVQVDIDATGKVVKAEALPAQEAIPPLLIATAVNAAKLWKFQPARKGTDAIPAVFVVRFTFNPQR